MNPRGINLPTEREGWRKVLSTPLIRLDESRTVGLGDPLCIRRIDSVRGPVRLKSERSREAADSATKIPNIIFPIRGSRVSPEIIRCCGSVLRYGLQKHYICGESLLRYFAPKIIREIDCEDQRQQNLEKYFKRLVNKISRVCYR